MYSFEQLAGQERNIRFLRGAIRQARWIHAYLFLGPEGTGKKTLALAFAKALNCLDQQAFQAGQACGMCRSCQKIEHGNHPDVHLFQPQGTALRIDQAREIRRLAELKPYEGRYKVFILDQAERLTAEAANSLLKLLEEPPDRCAFILLASDLGAMLPTVVSRCVTVRTQPVPTAQMEAILQERARADGRELDPGDVRVACALAEGSVGKARDLAEGRLAGLRQAALQFVLNVGRWSAADCLDFSAHWEDKREEAGLLIQLLQGIYHDLLWIKLASGLAQGYLLHPDQAPALAEAARTLSLDAILQSLQLCRWVERQLDRNLSVRLALDVLLLDLRECFAGRDVPLVATEYEGG
ncbi:MAG: DNA polymerase III subunit delta' [Firmicutes bacterium]|nr:DNA polymerase III subunit delta' [Bacillota bacterium]